MNGSSLQAEHPIDELPAYVRGAASDPRDIARHVASCPSCRLEVEILRALEGSDAADLTDVERARVYRAFEARRRMGVGSAHGGATPSFLRVTWRVAAGLALLLTSVGVWQVVQRGQEEVSDWNPEVALEGFAEDLAGLEVPDREVRMAFGVSVLDETGIETPWVGLEDVGELQTPWEGER